MDSSNRAMRSSALIMRISIDPGVGKLALVGLLAGGIIVRLGAPGLPALLFTVGSSPEPGRFTDPASGTAPLVLALGGGRAPPTGIVMPGALETRLCI